MKIPTILFLICFPWFVWAETSVDFEKEIQEVTSQSAKEEMFLEWVIVESQINTSLADSLIAHRFQYVDSFSYENNINVLLIQIFNQWTNQVFCFPQLKEYNLNESDLFLMQVAFRSLHSRNIATSDYNSLLKRKDVYKNPILQAMYYTLLAYYENGTRAERYLFYNQAIKYAKKSDHPLLLPLTNDVSGHFYQLIEDYNTALEYYQENIVIGKDKNLMAVRVMSLDKVGKIHFILENFERAEKKYKEAEKHGKNLVLNYRKGQLFNNIGELYVTTGRVKKGIPYFHKALLLFYEINNYDGLTEVHKNVGRAYFQLGDYQLALENYNLSINLMDKSNEESEKGMLYYHRAELYLKMNQLEKAERNIVEAEQRNDATGRLISQRETYLLHSEIRDAMGDGKGAVYYLRKYVVISDSIRDLKRRERIAELSELFESEQKERKIAEQTKRIEQEKSERLLTENKLERTRHQNFRMGVVIFLLVVIFVAIIILIRFKNKQKVLLIRRKEAELKQTLLRTQMNPHFIFNAMSVIQSYIYEADVKNSSAFLIHFSKLMRLILENSTKEFISLSKELEIIGHYLVLQKMRFENRFDYQIHGDKAIDKQSVRVPPMLVQPFLENAIEHGELNFQESGIVGLDYEIKNNLFIFTVTDNGIGRKASQQNKSGTEKNKKHKSMAIELTKSRIELFNEKYKVKGSLTVTDTDEKEKTGTKVVIAIPFDTEF